MKTRPLRDDYKLKSTTFPEGFVFLQDTREQRSPLISRIPKGLVIKSCTLHNGDYSVLGFEGKFAIERKGISDLFPYCSSEREKTQAKMARFKEMDWVGLVIEAKERDILQYQQFTKVHPETIRGALISFEIRYGIHIYYNNDRAEIVRWMLDRAVKYWKVQHEV